MPLKQQEIPERKK